MAQGTRAQHVPRRPRNAVRTISRHLAVPLGVVSQALRISGSRTCTAAATTPPLSSSAPRARAPTSFSTLGAARLLWTKQAYDPGKDTTPPKPTTLAQIILYGTGGWAGPVLGTQVFSWHGMALAGAQIALAIDQEPNNFGDADGILGLAYNALNAAANTGNPTYPWHYTVKGTAASLVAFEKELANYAPIDVDPYFTQLANQGVVANKFAFYTLRSFPRVATADATLVTLAADLYNQGFLILGGGDDPAQADLYHGNFADVLVVDDLYYNVNLKSVQVGGSAAVQVAALPESVRRRRRIERHCRHRNQFPCARRGRLRRNPEWIEIGEPQVPAVASVRQFGSH